MTRAKIVACAFTVICPRCDEPLCEPNHGSQVWEDWQVEGEVVCACGAPVAVCLPKKFSAK